VENKAKVVERLFDKNGIDKVNTNSEIEQLALGFSKVLKYDLLLPYIDKYFDSIITVWRANSFAIAEDVLRDSYPARAALDAAAAGKDLVAAASNWLTRNPSEPAALRRIVRENRDLTLRALDAARQTEETF
jgi:aminopeptidase N